MIPSRSARACATVIISGTKSEEMSVPPGAICSAARKPTSPVPAASSSTSWPGWSSSASTIQTETGIVAAAMRSACAPQPRACRPQRARLSLR